MGYGMVRIGLATSDLIHVIASPLTVVKAGKKTEETIEKILIALEEKDPERFVLGLPLLLTGKDSHILK